MNPISRKVVVATLLWSVALVSVCGVTAHAGTARADSAGRLRQSPVVPGPGELRLGRAAMEQRRGNLRGVIEALDGLEFAHGPSFAGADRAAFLLAQAYRQLGDAARSEALATAVAAWPVQTTYTRLLAFEQRFADNASPRRVVEGGSAGELSPLALYAGALQGDSAGVADPARWTAVANADTSSALGRDLAGAALVHLAAGALARGEDAGPWLERVPAGSRYSSRALHLRGLAELEAGRAASGTALLAGVLADSAYGARREVLQALASAAMARADWEGAHAWYDQADREWAAQREGLRRLQSAPALDPVWAAWQANPDSSMGLVIDPAPGRSLAARYADASADIVAAWSAVAPAVDVPARNGVATIGVLPPSTEDWEAVAVSARAVAASRGEWERARWAADREGEWLADRRQYLGLGLDRTRRSLELLVPRLARLDSLRLAIDSLDARLRWLRDAEGRRLAARLKAIETTSRRRATWMLGMYQLYVTGPDSSRQQGLRNGMPGPDRALATERTLNQELLDEAGRMQQATPGLLARSYEQSWGPRLIDRMMAQASDAGRKVRWARALAATLDSSIAAARTGEALERANARVAALETTTRGLAEADAALRSRVARDAVGRTLAAIESEREPIEYGLAATAYALAVRLGASDSASAHVALSTGAGPAAHSDTARTASGSEDEPEDPESLRWRAAALPALRAFLAAHPRSPARGEFRFRLADLELLSARQAFREQMAAFLGSSNDGNGAHSVVPVMDASRALTLYRLILSEDLEFDHLDAVRFNAGMILADAGDPEAGRFFRDLVTLSPGSAYGQEAWLRMGDMAFNEKRFPESISLYAHAAEGGDPTLAVIANYKLGWAHFNQDHFLPAADAFRSVLDLYATRRPQIGVDIEGEAESYFVHSLAGAGGAAAFGPYFDHIGTRPYEARMLMALGQHFRRYGDFAHATEVDELVLSRFPTHAEALVAAQRLIETHQRSNHPALVHQARAAYAARFAQGGAWYEAQAADTSRAAGVAFARSAYFAEAFEHHALARESGSRDEWRETARAYEDVIAHWPNDPDVARLRLGAGEANLRLGNYPGALAHFAAAERSGADSIVMQAQLQRVAATDAWYESTRSGSGTGSDSLARAVLAAGDALIARAPGHPRSADIVWRESQLALAHGWNDRAVADLQRMATSHAGDPRAPLAASQLGETLFRMGRFADAGEAFAGALVSARAQGRDSLARRAEAALPVCAYRDAEAGVAADSTKYARHAARFEALAVRWPEYELAPRSQYRAGIAYQRAGQARDAVRVFQALLQRYPRCEFVSDARLQVAQAWDGIGEREQAAQAYIDFSRNDTDRESAAAAWLKAAELLAAAGQVSRADDLRLEYLHKYPEDVESAMQITEALARRDLAGVGVGHPVSALLDGPRRAGKPPVPRSHLADYLVRAKSHPALASRSLIAQVRFLQAEEAGVAFAALRLTQPLAKSIPVKKRLLDTLLVRYRRSADMGVAEWAHASAFRMGQVLEDFAGALEQSDPPADLSGDDLGAYRNVLADRARVFRNRGEDVWEELLRKHAPDAPSDSWLEQARAALWQRLAYRFLFLPEVEFPLVRADGAGQGRTPDASSGSSGAADPGPPRPARALAQREGDPR